MPVDIYNPAVLNRIVRDLQDDVITFLLDRFFAEVSASTQEEIYFDVVEGKPRIAPFVSPLVEGMIVESTDYRTKSFKPAYIKDKRVFEAGRAFRRRPGQPIAAPINPQAAQRADLAAALMDQVKMLKRRLEWMAAQVLRNGKVTISGERYPTTLVDFGRNPALDVTLAGTALWSDAGASPLDDLETWAGLIRTHSGSNANTVIITQEIWKAIRKNAELRELLDAGRKSPATAVDLGPRVPRRGVSYVGSIGQFEFWIYSDSYIDPDDGLTKPFIPDSELLLVGDDLEGVQHFGAIKDEESFQATEYFSKSWTVPDPSARFLLMQSAPLVVPYRPNASLRAKVL